MLSHFVWKDIQYIPMLLWAVSTSCSHFQFSIKRFKINRLAIICWPSMLITKRKKRKKPTFHFIIFQLDDQQHALEKVNREIGAKQTDLRTLTSETDKHRQQLVSALQEGESEISATQQKIKVKSICHRTNTFYDRYFLTRHFTSFLFNICDSHVFF